MDNGSTERKNYKFTDIKKLSQRLEPDYNEFFKGEFGLGRYSMNHILRDYAGLDDNFRLHVFFEHGIIFTEDVTGPFRVHEYLPSMVASPYRFNVLKNQSNFKGSYVIGPYIHYADSLLSNDELNEEKERLGKTLLVFPSHSIVGIIKKFNHDNFISKINDVAKDFDSVRICMYSKDVLLGNHIPYQKEGYEIVTAGHYNDYNFLPRLKSIILNSDMAMANDIGSQLGYCLYLDKPYYITSMDEVSYHGEGDSQKDKFLLVNQNLAMESFNNSDYVVKIKHLFSNSDEKITQEQYDLASYLWGFNCIKSKNELKEIFLEANQNFSYVKYYLSQFKRLKELIKLKYIDTRKI